MPLNISLKGLRANCGMSLEQVAEVLGISRETYRKKEANETKLTLDEGFTLAELFNCSIADIRSATKV